MIAGREAIRKKETIKELLVTTDEILHLPADMLLAKLNSSHAGLTAKNAIELLEIYGHNEIARKERRTAFIRFASNFRSPLILILLAAGAISGFLGELTNSIIIYSLVIMSISLTFYQETKAERAADALKERVATTSTVLRNNIKQEIPLADLVPGDVIYLSGGDLTPADARVLAAKDFFIDQSALTGESFPVEKIPFLSGGHETNTIAEWDNYLFMGTSVVSGSATAVVVKTGNSTEYGKIIKSLIARAPETEFEKGLRKFGYLIMQVIFTLVIFVFFILALLKGEILQSLLFSVALAVGLTPELLPMILTVNLSKGATLMSNQGVIVKRLSSIQNFGNMDVLCTDKTGTLTENKVTLILHIDLDGKDDDKVLLQSYLNSYYQTGLKSPLDKAILEYGHLDIKDYQKIDEVPFDFTRRRVSVIVDQLGERFFITKGAPEEIAKVCVYYDLLDKVYDMNADINEKIQKKFLELSTDGFRVLGIAYKKLKEAKQTYAISDESDMVFLGFIAFMDPPKETAKESLDLFTKSGIELKILTGDNEIVTRKVCQELGFEIKGVVLGNDVLSMNDDALNRVVNEANIFARVTPTQKNRIINALKVNRHVVGFLGDGINDAPSMKVADVSISVDNAVDVAKESADIILLHTDLTVLNKGVIEGRRTFGNTMKYVLMAISSNFGNMFSAAGASLFLPFLPLLPIQILLNNFLYDMSELSITTDRVDPEYVERPKRLDIPYIKSFMVTFGLISSLFDFLTFFVLLFVFDSWKTPQFFQTAWFIESLSTQTLAIFVIRTRKSPFFRSHPSKPLLYSSIVVVLISVAIPFTMVGQWFQFIPLPINFFLFLIAFISAYVILVELTKKWFYRRHRLNIERYA